MKTAYTPDNTRSSIMILLSLAVAVTVVAALIGLSDKPDVSTIVISPNGVSASVPGPAANFGFGTEDESGDVLLDELGQPFDDTGDATDGSPAAGTRTPEGQVIVVPTVEATALPTPTAQAAAAVEPTPVPDQSSVAADASSAVQAAPSLPTTSGTVEGSFFTKGDENDGATVAQNLITVSFAEDGSGSFQGVLDITYVDGTHILLNMSGPLTWAPTNPQVEATLSGAFTLDAPIDADDVSTDDAKLSISSLQAGSGSLCTTKCFGFTFPPQ